MTEQKGSKILGADFRDAASTNKSLTLLKGYFTARGAEGLYNGTMVEPVLIPAIEADIMFDVFRNGILAIPPYFTLRDLHSAIHNENVRRTTTVTLEIEKFAKYHQQAIGILTEYLQSTKYSALLVDNLVPDANAIPPVIGWPRIITRIRTNYAKDNVLGHAALNSELLEISIARNEDFRAFILRLQDLINKLNEAGETFNESTIKTKIIENCSSDCRVVIRLAMANNETLEQIIQKALIFGTDDFTPNHKINAHSVNFIQGGKQKKDYRPSNKQSMNRGQTRRDSHKNQVYGKEYVNGRSGNRGRVGRFNRGGGHYGNTPTNQSWVASATCYNCGKTGHLASNCKYAAKNKV